MMEIKFGWSGKKAVRLGCLVLLGIDSGAHPRRFSRGKGAGDIWMVRMEECLALEAAYVRREMEKQRQQLQSLMDALGHS